MLYLILFLPLLGSFISAFFYKKIGDRACQIITSSFVVIGAILSSIILLETIKSGKIYEYPILNWISSGTLKLHWSIYVDSLTAVMLVVVNSVSALVHIYSIGYMSHDPHKPRFMSYLSLFTFMMLSLITADNFLQLFFGWEGVGLASYLLIGFWFKKESANNASMKAFIVNRVGDLGLLIAMFLIFKTFGTLTFSEVFSQAADQSKNLIKIFGGEYNLITTICVFLFIGAMGKSAQILLHTWLPDAMEGPTPVSALIHAATMVTAGVFLVARCSPLFEYSQYALNLVAFVGATTAIFAASVAIVQTDIKRIIAYSTCSQLGYMFFAAGMGAYNVAIFHLFTHAFFKALLFLGAGSVIHAFHDEQNIEKMGGVWKKIPMTYALMLIGTLALTGFPLLAGFYSKDAIIESAYFSKSLFAGYAFVIGVTTAFITSIYSWRLVFKTFHGKYNNTMSFEKVHESGPVMIVPLLLLAVGAIFSGYVFHEIFIGENTQFWGKAIFFLKQTAHGHPPLWLMILIPTLVISAIPLSFILFLKRKDIVEGFVNNNKPFYNFLVKKWYFDELYDLIFVKTFRSIGTFLWQRGDVKTIDAYGPDGVARVVKNLSDRASSVQSGYLYHYATVILIGVILIVSFLIII
ncbi:MAG: NADH-quinone oxidoreductase subunit L [Proteobacteria bacterium]|jgi:NADH-quinone oxidoreductase subunit L|uniref:NADH-ubiquinone oxidoreductase chain 5 n=4 Tax=Candidatus Fonsibacter lacus TaxID=2576439 RepID=A0A964UZL8_9PROT|nr:NADH-quinone oxidoreductase subunit L [Candidatus Fonsibacter lacus]NBP59818.1 NADH-quinone oxidoreductase subunit L [Pseudomonadota bacterium]NDB48679.1 NADH-quinone oxidoreductase subunit L [Pseudomonadota bacterium]